MDNVQTKIWNISFISVFAANILMYTAQNMLNVLIAPYAITMTASLTLAGMISGMFTYTCILCKLISAPAIDTFNRKYILTGAMLIMAAAYLGYSFSTNLQMLMLSRLLQGCGQAFTATCCLTLATDALPAHKLASGLGIFSLAQAAAQAIAPQIGIAIQTNFGYKASFLTAALTMLAAAFLAMQIKVEHKRTKKFRISLHNMLAKEAFVPTILMFFLALTNYNITVFLKLYADSVGCAANIGWYFTVYSATLLFTRPFVGRMADKYGVVKLLLPGMFFFALAFHLVSFAHTLPMFLFSAFISAFGFGACQPLVQTLAMKSVPKERRGAASCTCYIGMDLGNLIGPIIGGSVAAAFGYAAMWRFMTIFIIVAIVILLATRRIIEQLGE